MSEHRRKPPQPNGGGRAAGRRGSEPPPAPSPGRRAAPPRGSAAPYGGNPPGPGRPPAAGGDRGAGNGYRGGPERHHEEAPRPYGGRAEARRAAQRGGRRRGAEAPGPGGGRRGGNGPGGRGPHGPKPKRLIDYPRWGKDGWHRWVPSWRQSLGICVAFSGTLVVLIGVAYMMVSIPNENAAAATQKNVYYWADGSRMVISGGGDLNREVVSYDQIPKSMQNAVVSAENASFWTDSGIDPQGIARAIVKMAEGGETQSGSTITQQYVKNTYLDQSQTITRKFKEMLISIKVGEQMQKSQILAGYLNTGYYGRGAYGIQAASQAYYGVNCDKLTPSQSAFLAGLLNGPNIYDPAGGVGPGATPAENKQRAVARWSWILNREVITKDMTQAQRAQYKTFPMPEAPKPATNQAGQIGYLTQLANNYVTANTSITQSKLDRGGYQIYTTFNKKDVNAMQASVKELYKEHINPKLRPSTDSYLQVGGASVTPSTGAIVAIYGGSDYLQHYMDNADYTGAQVGSTFKPFVLAAAMDYGVLNPQLPADQPDSDRIKVSPMSVFPAENHFKVQLWNGQPWMDKDGNEWRQPNDDNTPYPHGLTLKYAMQESVNTTYVQLGMDVGLNKVEQSALAAGVPKDNLASATVPSFSIGTSAPSAIRMADAYATFDNNGTHLEPFSVEKVVNSTGVVYTHKLQPTVAYPSAVAQNVTSVLQNVVQHGTGTNALALGRPVAGKTGTTDSYKSAWFTGYTPQLATSIGLFRENDQAKNPGFLSMVGLGGNQKVYGADYPTQIWTDYMKVAMEGLPQENFPQAPSLGTLFYGNGMSATPTASPSPSVSVSPSVGPSTLPSTLPTPSVNPSASTCGFFGCQNGGGQNGGGGNAGGGTGGVPSTSPSTDTGTNGGTSTRGGSNGGGNNGGLFGGG